MKLAVSYELGSQLGSTLKFVFLSQRIGGVFVFKKKLILQPLQPHTKPKELKDIGRNC